MSIKPMFYQINVDRLNWGLLYVRTNCNHLKHGGDLENKGKPASFMTSASRSRLSASIFLVNIKMKCENIKIVLLGSAQHHVGHM